MSADYLIGIVIGIVIGIILSVSTYWFWRDQLMEKNETTGSGRFERIQKLFLQLEDLRKRKADFDKSQNERIKTTQDAIIKMVKADPNQEELELESRE